MSRTVMAGVAVGVMAVSLLGAVAVGRIANYAQDAAQWPDATAHLHGYVERAAHTPCSEEDSVNCYWDAQLMGNHKGHSFYSLRVGHSTCVVYWDPAYNRANGKCYPRASVTKGGQR